MGSRGTETAPRHDRADAVTRGVLAFTARDGGRLLTFTRWGLPFVAVVSVALVQYAAFPEPSIAPFVFFYVAVALTAGIVGRGPGLLCVLLSAALANHVFMAPAGAWSLSRPALAATALFLVAASVVALACASFRTSLLRLEASARELDIRGELLRLSHDAILVWTLDGAIEFWNWGAQQLYGYASDEACGRSSHELLRTVFPRPWAEIRSELRTTSQWNGELTQRTKDGRPVVVSTSLQLVRGRDGAERVLEANRDITDRKRSEQALLESEERFAVMFRRAPLPMVWMKLPEGVVSDVSDAFLDFTGAERGAVIGSQGLISITHPEVRRGVLHEVLATGHAERELTLATSQHGPRRAHVTATAVSFRGERYLLGVLQDVTDRRRAEAALRASEERLRVLNEQLREADRRKDEFLGMLSHELRNPLAPIRNSLFILDHAEPTGPQARRAKEIARRQVAHLTRLVDDLLDVTRIARGKIELRRSDLDLAALARRAAEDHRPLMQDRRLEVEIIGPPTPVIVNGDETRLAQVLGNLLHNASKFTPAGGRVTLTVGTQDGKAVVHLSDTGIGMDAQTLGAIFEPFVQAKQSIARSEGGLGLGLALVKGLVAMHGGEVSARSAGHGQGTEFVITLPLDRRQTLRARPPTSGDERSTAPHRRVLVVDDNQDAAESLALLLELRGHEVTVAHDGPGAVASALASHPDIVLCDIGLPGMDGYEVARRLRAGGAKDIKLVAVSGYAQPEDVARATEAGFDAHVAKPPDPDRLAYLLQ